MSRPAEPASVLLIMGVLHTARLTQAEIIARVEQEFGPTQAVSTPFPFDCTTYYDDEMGRGLSRWFCTFQNCVAPCDLAAIKLRTNALEQLWAQLGQRRVNLDPGLLTPHSLILATGKDFSHRIYLRDGIYAEVTLIVRGGNLDVLPWTYADYRLPSVRAFFDAERTAWLQARRHSRRTQASPEAPHA